MARPASTTTEETRARIVDAALRSFAREGYSAVSTRDLGAAAGVNVATLNYHFGSKQGLYDAVIDECYRRMNGEAGSVLAAMAGSDLRTALDATYRAARRESDVVRLLLREVLDHGKLSEQTRVDHFLPTLERLSELVGSVTGLPATQSRALITTLSFLMSRFVVHDEDNLRYAFGVESAEAAHAAVVDSLRRAAEGFLR